MGTNYYHEVVKCEHCGATERTHVGKSSGGWCFSLHVYPERGINDILDWSRVAETGLIFDEYGVEIPWAALHEAITNRHWDSPEDYKGYLDNHATPGPNGLARHRVDGEHCIGHGSGTWDYIVGEFS